MIIVLAHVTVHPGKGEQFIAAAQPCVEETQKEPGNISYRLVADTADSCRYTFVEEWASMEDLQAHMKTPHFLALGGKIEGLTAGPMNVDMFDAARR